MFRFVPFFLLFILPCANTLSAQSSVIASCGSSSGYAYFFPDPFWNPQNDNWSTDGIGTGQIRLILSGEDYDIEFGDVSGLNSYRRDGAQVILISRANDRLTFGAFHQNYTDLYTFDYANGVVAWSSHKLGPFAPKAATYVSRCTF